MRQFIGQKPGDPTYCDSEIEGEILDLSVIMLQEDKTLIKLWIERL